MQLLETKTTDYHLSLVGYNKQTPIVLKYIADSILVLIPAIDGLLLLLPGVEERVWLIFGWTTFAVLFKFITKFISEFPKRVPDIPDEA
jgi:hypothetical protein